MVALSGARADERQLMGEIAVLNSYYSWLAAFIMRVVVPFPVAVVRGSHACSRTSKQCAENCIVPACMR